MKNKTKKCKCGGTITYIKPKDKKSIYKVEFECDKCKCFGADFK